MQPWVRLDHTTKTKATWRSIVTKRFQLPDGKIGDFDTFSEEGVKSACIIALTKDNKVIIAEQFRVGPEKVCQELPGGRIDVDEKPQDAALRELKEETGYTTLRMPLFLGSAIADGYSNIMHHYFFVTDCKKTHDQNLDEGEIVNVKEISITELINNAKTDQMTDPLAVFYAYDQLMHVQRSEEMKEKII